MFARLLLMLGLLLAIPLVLPSAAQAQDRGGLPLMPCNSINYQPARCPASLSYGGAAYLRQVVGGQCGPLGSNWGWDGGGVWVRNGCRGIFAVQYGNGGGSPAGGAFPGAPIRPPPGAGFRPVRCESFNYRPARCATDVLGPPHIQQLLGGQCIRSQTWDFDRGGISVRGGCRAIFAVPAAVAGGGFPGGGFPGGGPGWQGGSVIECNSWNYRPAVCPAPGARRASVVNVLGGECIEGQTWGWARGAIWVNSGCRARFRVY